MVKVVQMLEGVVDVDYVFLYYDFFYMVSGDVLLDLLMIFIYICSVFFSVIEFNDDSLELEVLRS